MFQQGHAGLLKLGAVRFNPRTFYRLHKREHLEA